MPDPVVLAIATTLAAKGAEVLVSGGRDAIGSLYRLVRARFGSDPAGSAALEAAIQDPAVTDRQLELAAELARVMALDDSFSRAVRNTWQRIESDVSVQSDGVSNQFSGSADQVVQSRDISGGITFFGNTS